VSKGGTKKFEESKTGAKKSESLKTGSKKGCQRKRGVGYLSPEHHHRRGYKPTVGFILISHPGVELVIRWKRFEDDKKGGNLSRIGGYLSRMTDRTITFISRRVLAMCRCTVVMFGVYTSTEDPWEQVFLKRGIKGKTTNSLLRRDCFYLIVLTGPHKMFTWNGPRICRLHSIVLPESPGTWSQSWVPVLRFTASR
jgi:hypothetical protein